MRIPPGYAVVLAFTVGCSASDATPGPLVGAGGGAGPSGSGGTASSAGGALGTSFGGLGGGAVNGGPPAGAGGGPLGGAPSFGGATLGAGGVDSAGGTLGVAGSASGGASGCVPNLACTLTAPPTTGDLAQDCVDRINQFRTECACLPPLARWTDGEGCADQMSQYDSEQNSAHAGFIAKICTGGSAEDECPGYRSDAQVVSTCLQQMWNEGPPPQTPCTGTCFEQYGHFINMTNTRYTKVACGFYTTPSGKVWAAQNFSR